MIPTQPTQPVPSCLPGTRRDVFGKIQTWLENADTKNVLWLQAFPGAGKSCVASSLIREPPPSTSIIASHFFQRHHTNFHGPASMCLKIAAALSNLDVQLGKKVAESLERKRVDFATERADELFKRLISTPIAESNNPLFNYPILVVVDGLDECGNREMIDQVLSCIIEWSRLPTTMKLFVTSRNEPAIEAALTPLASRLELSLGSDEAHSDIHLFLQAQCAKIAAGLPRSLAPTWPGERNILQLGTRAAGLFIYATTLINFIQVDPQKQLERILRADLGNRGDIQTLYGLILELSFSENLDPDFFRDFRTIVGVIVLLKNSNDSEAIITNVLGVEPTRLESVSRGLWSVMDHTDSGSLHLDLVFRHQSFTDYLISGGCPEKFRVDLRIQMKNLTIGYLQVLDRGLQFNIGELDDSYVESDPDSISDKIPHYLISACSGWGEYLGNMAGSSRIRKGTRKILTKYFLYWLEVLSLVGDMVAARQNLLSLAGWLTSTVCPFVNDALSFLTTFQDPISRSAPHIYLSALPFTPSDSRIFLAYKDLFPNTISLDHHDVSSATRKHKSGITSVSTSSTGYIASASGDGNICLWYPTTGAPVTNPLCGHTGAVTCISFSPTGTCIASASEDHTIVMWDLENETRRFIIKEHDSGVTCLAFWPDGNAIISGSQDGMVRMWDSKTGESLCDPYQPHEGAPVTSLAVGPDDLKLFVSVSFHKKTFRVLRFTGNRIHAYASYSPLQAPSALTSVACSADGTWIVAGSIDCNVRAWSKDGKELPVSPMSGHSDEVACIAIHGNYIASGSADRTVMVWDITTGDAIAGPFHGHRESIATLAFSQDGTYLVSGSQDQTIRVWNTSDIVPQQKGHSVGLGLKQNSTIDAGGWIRGAQGKRLVWVPPKERARICWGRCTALIDGEPWKRLDFSNCQSGLNWEKCKAI
ncbi:WD40-repeat-containing domain protein [Mycena epipterygia]|nr:WD40-repeat-containing domain protein [Mycena epipterygia]